MLDDFLNVYLEWVSIVSGLVHFHLQYDFGSPEEVDLLLDALKDFVGFTEHHN